MKHKKYLDKYENYCKIQQRQQLQQRQLQQQNLLQKQR